MSVIEVVSLGKRYQQVQDRGTLVASLMPFLRGKRTERWAVRDVSFAVDPGETVGLLGHNGAGKTTMLRLLAGVSRPTEGSLTVRGRIAPLISVGVGFHQEMTGRENIYVNGLLLGLNKRQIASRLDEIIGFAELEEYIDTPVKFYSSGMYMRLGFAVAVHVDPEILLVDEILAVGDIAFQLKCFERMRRMQSQGTTILLVSHNLHAIRLLCPRALLIRGGRLLMDGSAEEAIALHHELMGGDPAESGVGQSGATILSRTLLCGHRPTHHPDADATLTYRVDVRFEETTDSPAVVFNVLSDTGGLVYSRMSVLGSRGRTYEAGATATIDIEFVARLGGGSYRLVFSLTDRFGRQSLAKDGNGLLMYLAPQEGVGGVADLRAAINIDGENVSEYASFMMGRPASDLPPDLLGTG